MGYWIKLHKQVLDNPTWRNDRTAWHIFETLLLLANQNGEWSGGMHTLAELSGEKRSTIYKAIKRLKKAKMVNTLVNSSYTTYNILNYGKYQTHGKQLGNTSGNTIIRIENKNINTNTSVLVFGDAKINDMFTYWKETTGYEIQSRQQANRRAAYNLLRKHGEDGVKRLIRGVALAQQDKYAPRIANFEQLQSKQDDLLVWGKQISKRTEII